MPLSAPFPPSDSEMNPPPQVDADDAQRMRQGATQLDPFARVASNATSHDQFSRHYGPQFINCDIRTFPLEVLGKFPVRLITG